MLGLLASAWLIVAPSDWTADPNDPPQTEVVMYWWAEDDHEHLLGHSQYINYMPAGSTVEVDLGVIPAGTYVCLRGWVATSRIVTPRRERNTFDDGIDGFQDFESRCAEAR